MDDLLSTLDEWLAAGETVVAATIATNEGSTPRTAGSKMLVRTGGRIAGTVGGGLVEAQVIEAAQRVMDEGGARLLDFDLTGEMAAGADMICGGKLRVFLERIEPGVGAGLFAELAGRLRTGERCLLLTPLSGGERSLLGTRGPDAGAALPPEIAEAARAAGASIQAPVLFEAYGRQWFLEPWSFPDPLFIAGAGHVSRPTAAVAVMVGFRVTVLDDRPDFASRERFPTAHEILVPGDMARCLDGVEIGPEASVVIVTRGHVHDASVLAQALRTKAGYIGMIGSRRKRDAVYDRLRGQGFTDADFARVHCPVGLSIDAETPEEIAVSIAAELIQERARRRGL
ncbi:XshC-Cox1-family protein [Desulfovibrio sp. X2]|uniref:XdhC family aldehyde oxidoreductase maturation factor n=1 Tax=Desulfovibrio sp. X2 TaxID=941449 RepID=UPI00035875F8|nr:XdhC/CoxI family protein [Desulfovibrio sp. X2]EPR41249.1 XshC-Cox1-family protein [Desulfovibrio sp. X2]